VLSPLLNTLVPTLKVVRLAWYVLPYYARILGVMLRDSKTAMVVMFKIYDGTNWKTVNESFYWDESTTLVQWGDHWLNGIRKLN
jgi:hypothetical protein